MPTLGIWGVSLSDCAGEFIMLSGALIGRDSMVCLLRRGMGFVDLDFLEDGLLSTRVIWASRNSSSGREPSRTLLRGS